VATTTNYLRPTAGSGEMSTLQERIAEGRINTREKKERLSRMQYDIRSERTCPIKEGNVIGSSKGESPPLAELIP